MAHGAPAGRGRWAATRRRRAPPKPASVTTKLYESVVANDALETQIQNETSPFPPTYTEHVARRDVPTPTVAGLPTLRDVALRVAGKHFATHILPTTEVLDALRGAKRAPRPPAQPPRKRQRDAAEAAYTPDDAPHDAAECMHGHASRLPRCTYSEALAWSEMNRTLLKHLPPPLVHELFDAVCRYAPEALTKEVLATYFLPHVAPEPPASTPCAQAVPPLPLAARVRQRIFFPASLPLFSQDRKAAALLLAMLAGALALSPSAARLTAPIEALDLHGLTRLQDSSLLRLLRAPPQPVPQALPPPWQLRRVTLPGCTALSDAAITALVQTTGATLEHLDLTMTAASAAAVHEVGARCPALRVLRVAWCERITDASLADAVSACVAHCAQATPPCIPFQHLESLDVAHTAVGDVAVGGLLRLCGTQLRALDVGYTSVGEGGSLDMLALGLGVPGGHAGASRLEHLGLAGLCVHTASLLTLVRRLLAHALRSLQLDDLVEYARRHPSSLQGRQGLAGAALRVLAQGVADTAQRRATPFHLFSARGDKRRAAVPGHWAVAGTDADLGTALHALLASCHRVALSGLHISAYDLTPRTLHTPHTHTLTLNGTALCDTALEALVPWTGALEAVYLDDTPITRTYRADPAHALDRLIDSNPRLTLVSLSQCRGIPVTARRDYFRARPLRPAAHSTK